LQHPIQNFAPHWLMTLVQESSIHTRRCGKVLCFHCAFHSKLEDEGRVLDASHEMHSRSLNSNTITKRILHKSILLLSKKTISERARRSAAGKVTHKTRFKFSAPDQVQRW
jgi:hypothetical protein